MPNLYAMDNQAKTFQQEVKKIRDVAGATMTGGLPAENYMSGSSFASAGMSMKIICLRWG